ncbi:MAG: hypothetical protein ACLPN5_06550 [Roseiarcus sp.]
MAVLVTAIHVATHNFALPNFHVFLHEQWDKAGKSIGLHVDVDARDEPGHDDLGRWSPLAIPSAPCSLLKFDSVILRRRLRCDGVHADECAETSASTPMHAPMLLLGHRKHEADCRVYR